MARLGRGQPFGPIIQHIVPLAYDETGDSGVVCGGTATVTVDYAPVATGGVVLGGSSPLAITVPGDGVIALSGDILLTWGLPSTGGVVLAAAQEATADYTAASTGGAVLGGSSPPSLDLPSSGGAVVGGEASFDVNAEMTGGFVLDGTNQATVATTETAAGGAALGGTVPPDLSIPATGGVRKKRSGTSRICGPWAAPSTSAFGAFGWGEYCFT
jgi:hypothetical protein